MLRDMFERQGELNKRIGYDTKSLRDHWDSVSAGKWLNDYIIAASNELEELRDCTYWKHWCAEARSGERFAIWDLQNARVEVIDLLFFWISMAQCVGLSAEDVYNLYLQKLNVNHARQDGEYSMKNKTEADNKAVKVNEAERAIGITRPPADFVQRGEPTRAPVDLNEAVKEVAKLMSVQAQTHDVCMQLDLADDLPAITADRIQVQQVALNLIRNALEAMADSPREDRRLTIRTSLVGQDMVALTVRDRRPKVSVQTIEGLFAPSHMTNVSRPPAGLSISRSIIEALGGVLWAEPGDDHGLTVQFTLPISPGRRK